MVERLLVAGATVDAVTNQGLTTLHVAAFNGHDDVAQRLLIAMADAGQTPPDYEAFKSGVDEHMVLVVDDKGQTQLHYAALSGNVAAVEQLLAAGAAVDAVDNEGRTAYDLAKKEGHRKVMGLLDPVLVVLLSGRSCRCDSSDDRSVQDLKEEAENKLQIKIQHLIGPNMEQLTESKSLAESNIAPGSTVFVVNSPETDQRHQSNPPGEPAAQDPAKQEPAMEGDFDLQEPSAFVNFLIAANIRLVRLEYLLELHERGLPMPRRQEAELLRTKEGATALVQLKEYKQLRIDGITGKVTVPTAQMPSVRFLSISHMWESREHPDPWNFQLSLVADRCKKYVGKGVTWAFVDYMSLYQFERKSTREDEWFRKALDDMHVLYSHEIVEVMILKDLTPKHLQIPRKLPIFSVEKNRVALVYISALTLNPTPHQLRGWCQAERQWALLRTVLESCGIPMPPEEFKKVMKNLEFTHRDDSETVFQLQEKVFTAKTASTTHLQLERLTEEALVLLRLALPYYKQLTHLVINGTELKSEDAIAVVSSGAQDIQMEACKLESDDAVLLAAKLTEESTHQLKQLSLARNCIDEIGQSALMEVMHKRPDLKISLARQFDEDQN